MIFRLIFTLLFSMAALADGNTTIQSFSKAKKLLEREVYHDHRETIYCAADFTPTKQVIAPEGFISKKHVKRSLRVEWEHVVPAENFGRTFTEWREGHPECISSKGKPFKGRKCASKMNQQYRYIQADMHNLFPAIGSVNALRSNYSFTVLPAEDADFGSCNMKIDSRKAEPPERSRGRVARTYMYMDQAYQAFSMSRKTRQLMTAWDKQYPVSEWECEREARITKVQGNRNHVTQARCSKDGRL